MTESPSETMTETGSELVWGTTAFVPGSDVGLVGRHTIALIERNNPSTRERLWGLVSVDAAIDDVLDELSSTRLKSLPDFGVAQVEGDAVRVVARGRAVVTATLGSGGTRVVDATTVRTWIEEVVADVVSVTISLDPADGDSTDVGGDTFAVLAGSVPAASLTRRYDVADPHAEAATGWPGTSSGSAGPDASIAVSSVVMTDQAADATHEPADDAGDDAVDDLGALFDDELRDQLGDTGDVEVNLDAPIAPASPWSVAPSTPSDPQPPVPDFGEADLAFIDAEPSEAIDSLPDTTIIVEPDDFATRAPAPFDAEADLAQSLDEDPPAGSTAVVGVLIFSNGVRIEVDRSVLIGRNPKLTGSVDGLIPHIMKYEGQGQGLSRTHAEVRVENSQMVLEDLNSTNGTEVELPGEPRRRLHGGDPVVLVPGTLIDLGDELTCVVESAR